MSAQHNLRCHLGDWFCVSRNGGTGGGGLVHPNGENSTAVSGLGCENPSAGPFLLFYIQMELENSDITS